MMRWVIQYPESLLAHFSGIHTLRSSVLLKLLRSWDSTLSNTDGVPSAYLKSWIKWTQPPKICDYFCIAILLEAFCCLYCKPIFTLTRISHIYFATWMWLNIFFHDSEEKKKQHLKPLDVAVLPLVGWCHDGEKRYEIIEQKIILALGKVET